MTTEHIQETSIENEICHMHFQTKWQQSFTISQEVWLVIFETHSRVIFGELISKKKKIWVLESFLKTIILLISNKM